MEREEIRRLMDALTRRVSLESEDARAVVFDAPDEAALVADGFDAACMRRMLASPWWPEMIEEIVETPEFCGAEESPAEAHRQKDCPESRQDRG